MTNEVIDSIDNRFNAVNVIGVSLFLICIGYGVKTKQKLWHYALLLLVIVPLTEYASVIYTLRRE